ncbi:MAG TPA: hypothetical protein VFK14_00145 [Solirubrobacterales bacterium]|nr:hypothetical protein [Solirubrobacterales bacterium]
MIAVVMLALAPAAGAVLLVAGRTGLKGITSPLPSGFSREGDMRLM